MRLYAATNVPRIRKTSIRLISRYKSAAAALAAQRIQFLEITACTTLRRKKEQAENDLRRFSIKMESSPLKMSARG